MKLYKRQGRFIRKLRHRLTREQFHSRAVRIAWRRMNREAQ